MPKIVFFFLLVCLSPRVWSVEQHAAICKFEVRPSKAVTGASSYDFTGTICFERSMDDFRKAGDSTEKNYILTIKFKEGTRPVTANIGFSKPYCDEDGIVTFHKSQKLSQSNALTYDFAFNIPVSAFKLPEGKNTLLPIMSIIEEETSRSVLRKGKIMPVVLQILPVEKIRIWVKHILVDSLDADGRLWDYFVFNSIESNPDIVWSLKYAGQTYFASKMRLNTFEYSDNNQHETYQLTISKGDTISIEVKDVDDLTPDDIIGTVLVVPTKTINQNESIITGRTGQIRSLEYAILPIN